MPRQKSKDKSAKDKVNKDKRGTKKWTKTKCANIYNKLDKVDTFYLLLQKQIRQTEYAP